MLPHLAPPKSLWVWALLLLPSLLTLSSMLLSSLLQFNSWNMFPEQMPYLFYLSQSRFWTFAKELAWWFWLFLLSASLDQQSSCQWTLISINFVKVPQQKEPGNQPLTEISNANIKVISNFPLSRINKTMNSLARPCEKFKFWQFWHGKV